MGDTHFVYTVERPLGVHASQAALNSPFRFNSPRPRPHAPTVPPPPQDAVAQLARDQPLLLMHEPSNAYDAHAMAVRTLGGRELGYVPRGFNQMFAAHVASEGEAPRLSVLAGRAGQVRCGWGVGRGVLCAGVLVGVRAVPRCGGWVGALRPWQGGGGVSAAR